MAPKKKLKTDEKEPPADESPKSTGRTTRSKAAELSPAGSNDRGEGGDSSPSKPKHGWGGVPDPEKVMKENRKNNRGRRVAERAAVVGEKNPGQGEALNQGDTDEGNQEANADEVEKVKSGDDAAAKAAYEEVQAVEKSSEVAEDEEVEVAAEAAAGSSKGKGKMIEEDEDEAKERKNRKRILIRYCRLDSDPAFDAKAREVKAALETVAGCKVKIKTDAQKGCFEVEEVGGDEIIQLKDLVAPYQKLVELDPDTIVAAVIAD